MKKDVLIQYLEQIYNLEKSIVTQKKQISAIGNKIYYVRRTPMEREIKEADYENLSMEIAYLLMGVMGGLIVGLVIIVVMTFSLKTLVDWWPKIFLVCVMVICTWIGVNIWRAHHGVDKYNEEVRIKNDEIELNNEKRVQWVNNEVVILQNEQNNLNEKLKCTENVLEQMYAANIIFPKYRNIIAVSSFYEYILSGRCDELEGRDGAYNIFENEVRMELIVYKMDEIINKLDEIKEHQYMLYSAMQESNQRINKLSNELDSIVANSQRIEENTQMMEYYSWISATNTEALKWETLGLLTSK